MLGGGAAQINNFDSLGMAGFAGGALEPSEFTQIRTAIHALDQSAKLVSEKNMNTENHCGAPISSP